MAAFYGLYAYLGAHLTEVFSTSTALAGVAALSYGIGFGVVAPLDRLIDKYGAQRAAPVLSSGLHCGYPPLSAISGSWALVLATCLIWGADNHLGFNVLVAQLTALSPSQRGTILGLYVAVNYASIFVGTFAFKWIFETGGFLAAALASAACIGPAVVNFLRKRALTCSPEMSSHFG